MGIPWAQLWLTLSILDYIFLVGSWYAVVRDLGRPPATDEQHVLQISGYLAGASLGAVFLYLRRPTNKA